GDGGGRMSRLVCLAANTFYYPEGGGHTWVYLNWALGLAAHGCRVIWLEGLVPHPEQDPAMLAALRERLRPNGLSDHIALYSHGPLTASLDPESYLDIEAAAEADLLLNLAYDLPEPIVARFRRSALIDIDPGLLQTWMADDSIRIPPHDVYFTTGETVGGPNR